MMCDTLYIIIPAYNEQENIENLISEWIPVVNLLPCARLVVINDGSTDNTYETLTAHETTNPNLIVLNKHNGGHGDTVLFGYRYAIEQGASWIFQTDSDGQTRAAEFQAFWNMRGDYDAIMGNRPFRGDGIIRKLVETVLCGMVRLFFGVKVPDANCPFRLMRASNVAEYIQKIPEHYFLPNVILTVQFTKYANVIFRDVTFENRKGGKGSINVRKIIKIGFQSIRDFNRLRKTI